MRNSTRIGQWALSTVLALCIIVSITVPAFAATFTDVPSTHWTYEYVEKAVANGLVSGVGNGKYEPERNVSNAEWATMIVNLLYENDTGRSGDYWWSANMDIAGSQRNVFAGTTVAANGTSSWDDNKVTSGINRYDMAMVICNISKEQGWTIPDTSNVSSQIADWSSIPSNYRDAVAYCFSAGFVTGVDSNRTFQGTGTMTRAQAATVLCRLLDAKGGDLSPDTGSSQGKNGTIRLEKVSETTAHIIFEPSTGIWTGEQAGRAYGYLIESASEIPGILEEIMDEYPKTLVFFSYNELTDPTPSYPTYNDLLSSYEITHGLHIRGNASCFSSTMARPASDKSAYINSAGEYYEYRLDLHYSAAGIVRMYREAVIPSLPDEMDLLTADPDEANYTLLLNAAEKIEKEYGLDTSSSDYEKVYAIYNYLTSNYTYDYTLQAITNPTAMADYYSNVLYPAEINLMLESGKGVCFNFTLTMQALCYIFDIDCYYVGGRAAGGNHAWNIVCIDNQWYHLDATWDVGKNPENYKYFLISDKKMLSGRTMETELYNYPSCPFNY